MKLINVHLLIALALCGLVSAAAATTVIDYGWEDEVIHFQRPGVDGQILVADTELRIQANLGFMLMMLKSPIEQEIVRYLEEHFGCRFES